VGEGEAGRGGAAEAAGGGALRAGESLGAVQIDAVKGKAGANGDGIGNGQGKAGAEGAAGAAGGGAALRAGASVAEMLEWMVGGTHVYARACTGARRHTGERDRCR
jgi:hypothetical protein